MADNKRLRVSKACDSCRRKKVKCDAIHPLCTNCETFNYECTYNDPTKKRGPPKGYIEAIEARLHRMEGLLGGLVKDKDPRAEIVRAELDAMAREAEMTGLKLRRSKAYEEINHAMGGSSSSSSSAQNGTNGSRASGSGPGSGSKPLVPASSSSSSLSSIRPQPPQNLQQLQPAPAYPQQRPHPKLEPRPHPGPGQVHSGSAYHPRSLPGSPSHGPTPRQPPLQPSASHSSSSNAYHPYDMSPQRHSQNPHRPQHSSNLSGSNSMYSQHHTQQPPTPSVPPSHQPYPPSYSSSNFANNHHSNTTEGVQTYNNSRGSLSGHQRSQSSRESQYRNDTKPPNHMQFNIQSNGTTHKNGIGATNHFSINRGNNCQASQRVVPHRPSLAHQFSDPMTGYMAIPQLDLEKDNTLILPTIEVMDHLLEMHFRSVHPVIPFLHYKTIYNQIHRNESPPSHLLFATLGLASRFSDNPAFRIPRPGVERPPCTIFYERAKHFIRDEYDNAQVATVQSLLLMAIQLMGFCESQKAWLNIGMAIRMAQDLGLNKEPSEQEKSRNPLLCEIRKRTWWSCYVLDRFVGQGLSRPLTISHGECETSFPQIEDEEVDLVSGRSIASSSRVMSNFVHMIRLSKIQGEILEFIQTKFAPSPVLKSVFADCPRNGVEQDRKIPVDTSAAAFAALDKSLTEWRLELPEDLQNPTAQSPDYGLFLHLTYNTLIILLHRPEIPNSPTSASLCTQAAVTISDITEILMETKALTSMFISCLYAIFSAGVVHFMNIPSVKRPNPSNTSSPVLDPSSSQGSMSSSTKSAKTNLKRCIDALKFLASHWVSAARRAKVLEDLLDLKHVSLKDLEVDTFKTSPVGPSWVLEAKKYKEALITPREGHDKLRQQCRSKVMAIHSLLVNDDDFQKLQRKRSFSADEESEDVEEASNSDSDVQNTEDNKSESKDGAMEVDQKLKRTGSEEAELTVSVASPTVSRPIGLGVQSPISSSASVSSPTSVRTEGSQHPSESDPAMVFSTAKLGLSDSPAVRDSVSDGTFAGLRPADVLSAAASGLVRHESGMLTPITMTTLQSTSPLLGPKSPSSSVGSSMSSGSTGRQGSMLDPFSMPSSINFPDLDRRPSTSATHNGANGSSGTTTIWSTDASTNRSTARSAASSPMLGKKSPMTAQSSATLAEPLTLHSEAIVSSSDARARSEQEEQDLVWNDMPPTLGLDEWTAYIGAMMMKWLASGQSSPRSTMSS